MVQVLMRENIDKLALRKIDKYNDIIDKTVVGTTLAIKYLGGKILVNHINFVVIFP